nr:MAG TPA: hypothetical protein [Caudoviricetes sp.]
MIFIRELLASFCNLHSLLEWTYIYLFLTVQNP